MEQKTKFILYGLIGVTIICFFLFVSTLGAKQKLKQQLDDLNKENTSLNAQVNKLGDELRKRQGESETLRREVTNLSQEKQSLEGKYNLVLRQKEELDKKLKEKQQEVQREAAPDAPPLPQSAESYWAGILKAKTDIEIQLNSIRNELKSAQINNEQLQREKSTLELDINNLTREREDLKRQLEYNQKIMDSIAQELVRERNDKIQIQESFKAIKNENTTLSRQLKSLNNRKINLERNLQELSEEKGNVERRFTEMETMLTDKLSQINDLKDQLDAIRSGQQKPGADKEKESVQLSPIVVRPRQEASIGQQGVADSTAKVLAINRENNFVIIDAGEESGLKAGDTFQVYSGNERIASIEVIKISKSVAACDIKREISPVKIGDTVR
ncbi:MAG: hypothetical protein PHU96_00980 [Candidatus Omnitrophica bacterium]|nr:hypothetical protein [Candidatus Omnitrophota bacterium]